jgi:hypothetical protein
MKFTACVNIKVEVSFCIKKKNKKNKVEQPLGVPTYRASAGLFYCNDVLQAEW